MELLEFFVETGDALIILLVFLSEQLILFDDVPVHDFEVVFCELAGVDIIDISE